MISCCHKLIQTTYAKKFATRLALVAAATASVRVSWQVFCGHRLQLRERTVPHCGALTALNTVGKPRSTGPTSEPIKPRLNPFSNFEHAKIRLVLVVCRSTVLNEGWKSRIPEHLLSYCSLGCRTVINFGAKTSSILFDFKILQTSNKTRFTSQSLFSCFKNILGPKQGSGGHLPTKVFDQDVLPGPQLEFHNIVFQLDFQQYLAQETPRSILPKFSYKHIFTRSLTMASPNLGSLKESHGTVDE